jgi:methylmalonyl-CoA/ethylmalonyl-CoA epimerase
MPALAQARIGQIAIVCKDVGRATAFYRDVLAMPFLFSAGPNLSFFRCGDVRLMLSHAEGDASGTSVLYFFVSDIDTARTEIANKGARVIGDPHVIAQMPDHQLWLCEFRDSEDNVLALMEERRQDK